MLTDYIYSNIIKHIINNILLLPHLSPSENVFHPQPRTQLFINHQWDISLARVRQSSVVVKNKHWDTNLARFSSRIWRSYITNIFH